MFGTEAENPDAHVPPPPPPAEERYPYVETRLDDEIRHPLPYFSMKHYKMADKVRLTCALMRLERGMYPLAALGIVMDGKARPEIEEYINSKEEEENAEMHEKEYDEEHEKWRNPRDFYTTWTRRSAIIRLMCTHPPHPLSNYKPPTTTVIDPQKRYPLTPPLLHDRRTFKKPSTMIDYDIEDVYNVMRI